MCKKFEKWEMAMGKEKRSESKVFIDIKEVQRAHCGRESMN